MVQQIRIPRPVLSLGTHAFLRAATLATPSVRQHLIVIHAEELLCRHRLSPFHLLPQRRTQRASPHVPELRHLDFQRIHLQRRTQRAEKLRFAGRGSQDKMNLILQRINSIDDVIISIKIELPSRLLAVDLLDRRDLNLRVDLQKMRFERVHLHLPDCFSRRHQLPVHISDADPVRVHDRQFRDPATHQPLRTPASDPADSEDDHPSPRKRLHHILSQKQFRPVVYRLFYRIHCHSLQS